MLGSPVSYILVSHLHSFLIGFGLTFAANAAPMLVTELSYPSYRAPLTALYNSLWYSGNIMYVIGSHEEAFISLISAFYTVLLGLRSALLASRATGPGVSPLSSRLSLLSSSSS